MGMRTDAKEAAQPASDQSQLERFKQTARELGCDETGEALERAFAKAVPPRKPGKKLKKD